MEVFKCFHYTGNEETSGRIIKKAPVQEIIWERRHSGFVAFPVGSEEVARHAQAGREARATWA